MPNVDIHIFRTTADELRIEPPYVFVKRNPADTVTWINHTEEELLWTFNGADDVFHVPGPPATAAAAPSRQNIGRRDSVAPNPLPTHRIQVKANAPRRNYKYSVYSKDRNELAQGSEAGVD